MRVIWAQDGSFLGGGIFLAGPTLREECVDWCKNCGGMGFYELLDGRHECEPCAGQGSFLVSSWRPGAIEKMLELGYQGELYVPERKGCGSCSTTQLDYTGQIEWERAALEAAEVIAFWIPRDLDILPGFTTNIEFGEWSGSGKCVLGFPPEAPKMGYLKHVAHEKGIVICHTLAETIAAAKEKHDQAHHRRP